MEATNGNLYPGLAERPGNVEGTRVLVRLDADESDQSEIAVAPKTGKKRGYVDVGIRLIDHRNVDAETAAALIAPAREGLLDAYPVSDAVNSADNDSPELIEPVPEKTEGELAEPAPRKTGKVKKDDAQASLF